jgi:hypothetical protein
MVRISSIACALTLVVASWSAGAEAKPQLGNTLVRCDKVNIRRKQIVFVGELSTIDNFLGAIIASKKLV